MPKLEKDEECRKYREYKARIGRKKQLELFWDNGGCEEGDKNKEDDVTKTKESGKSVSFPGRGNNEKAPVEKASDNNTKAGSKSSAATTDGECKSSASSSKKRSEPMGDGKNQIPRKKKRVNFGSLLPPAQSEKSAKEGNEGTGKPVKEDGEHMNDPSEERDRLRKELEEAEKLEIAAVELRRKMFGSRIVSRTDVGDLGKDVKSLKRVFPCGGVMVRPSPALPPLVTI